MCHSRSLMILSSSWFAPPHVSAKSARLLLERSILLAFILSLPTFAVIAGHVLVEGTIGNSSLECCAALENCNLQATAHVCGHFTLDVRLCVCVAGRVFQRQLHVHLLPRLLPRGLQWL